MQNKIKNSNQLRWVILLLAIAVILPTACLLWFMTQAVRNERLAIRQKLIDSYTARGQEIFKKATENFTNDTNNFSSTVQYVPQKFSIPSEALQKAKKLEFTDGDITGALAEYEKNKIYSDPAVVYVGLIGQARCLKYLHRYDEAINICRQCIDTQYFNDEQKAKAGLLLIDLYRKTNNQDLQKELKRLFTVNLSIPTETQVFILDRLTKIANEENLTQNLPKEILSAQKFIDSANLTIAATDFLDKNNITTEPNESFFKIATAPPMYGIYQNKNLLLVTQEKMTQFWQKSIDDFTDNLVFCKIHDDTGTIINKNTTDGELFSTLKLSNNFTGWKTELYLRSGVFKEAADKKRVIYIWVASIVIILMLASTLLASSAVLKQAKLNKLKNDFIATITHELKTPLASTRLLVDTLLENKCQNKQQEMEYLQLIAKENARLGRLIDNFLTFSRMERNKQVFEITKTSPVEIATAAAEAMHAKFENANVHFTLDIAKPMPMVNADKDAITTVLVNLLDNAYKYSNENKQIELNVFVEDSNVCFVVKDNGIGMTRRQMNKVFDKFYQADSSLSRKVEGTGLGLSIVKFIVDAHKGKISVESKIAKGSEFIVRIPTV
ncbi:MAG: HAMP domain-containing histidine kinase [Planctomycetaceae bacterium]|nr:HAMP domain-containing histidine kinase [Planctomycetaceae bacterium]